MVLVSRCLRMRESGFERNAAPPASIIPSGSVRFSAFVYPLAGKPIGRVGYISAVRRVRARAFEIDCDLRSKLAAGAGNGVQY